jgi:hypothetical protein
MEKQRRAGGKAEVHVLSGLGIYSFCRRTQTTHNQPNITFSVCEIADESTEFGILKIHTVNKLLSINLLFYSMFWIESKVVHVGAEKIITLWIWTQIRFDHFYLGHKETWFFTNATIPRRNLTMNIYCMQGAGKLAALTEGKWKREEEERQKYMSCQAPGYIHSAGGHKPHTISQILPTQYAR